MRPLVLCQSCKRHVKAGDAECPFCGSAVLAASNLAGVRARGRPGGRAALFLAGGALVPACAVETVPPDQNEGDAAAPRDAGSDAGHMAVAVYGVAIDSGLMVVPPYGVVIPPDAGTADAGTDASCPQIGNLPVPVYGIAVDSGTRANDCTDAGADAGHDAGPIAIPPYGIAIDRDR